MRTGISLILLFLSHEGLAFPSWNAQDGLMRILSAERDHMGYFGINLLHLNYLRGGDYHSIDFLTGMAYSPKEGITASFKLPLHYDQTLGETGLGPGDVEVGVKFSKELREGLLFGIYPFFSLPTGTEEEGLVRDFTTLGLDYGGLLLLTRKKEGGPTVHLNLGILNPYQQDGNGYESSQLLFRMGASLPERRVIPYVELSYDAFLFQYFGLGSYGRDSERKYGGSPLRFGGGLRIPFVENLVFDLGGSLYLTKRRVSGALPERSFLFPREDIKFEFSWGISTWVREREPLLGILTGQVVDAETKTSIQVGELFIRELNKDVAPGSNGHFRLEDLPPGPYTLKVQAEGYASYEKEWWVKPGETTLGEVLLHRLEGQDTVEIRVEDLRTHKGLSSLLQFTGGQSFKTGENGLIRLAVNRGRYEIQATRPGYKPQLVTIDVGTSGRSFRVSLEKEVLNLPPVHFDHGSYKIRSDDLPVLDQVGQTLKEKSTLRLLIGGHTSTEGDLVYNETLSRKRAEAVKAYLVDRYGIQADRLEIRGYSTVYPLAPNKTEEGKTENRRVEFKIREE